MSFNFKQISWVLNELLVNAWIIQKFFLAFTNFVKFDGFLFQISEEDFRMFVCIYIFLSAHFIDRNFVLPVVNTKPKLFLFMQPVCCTSLLTFWTFATFLFSALSTWTHPTFYLDCSLSSTPFELYALFLSLSTFFICFVLASYFSWVEDTPILMLYSFGKFG